MARELSTLWPLMMPVERQGDDNCTASAKGVRLTFHNGREVLCGTSGLWNTILGYGNEAIARAVHEALLDASYLTVWRYENTYARRAAEALTSVAGPEHYGRVLFSTGGGAANDLVMKVVRHFFALRGEYTRKGVVGLEGGWHGLTFGAAALTSGDLGDRVYGIDRRLVTHVRPNETAELDELLERHRGRIAAVVVEPVIGTGALELTEEFVAALMRLRRKHGFLLVADEVTSGFWRVGPFFVSQGWPEQPDLLITSKGLTNGTIAASAVIVSRRIADEFIEARTVLGHGETQAGSPAAAAAILATLDEMRRLDARALSTALAARLDTELAALTDEVEEVTGSVGRGCLRAVELRHPGTGAQLTDDETAGLVAAIRAEGAIVHPGSSGVQLLPALIYTAEDVSALFTCIRAGLKRWFLQ